MESLLGIDENHWCLHSWPRETGTKAGNEVTSVSKYHQREKELSRKDLCLGIG